MCDCPKHVRVGTYENQVTFDVPAHMAEYRARRIAAGLSGLICIDRCLVDEVLALWMAGIRTNGSCCGHNHVPPIISVFPEYIPAMKAMGYQVQFNPSRPYAEDGFIPKTVRA
ncbi:hypothetical protein [Thalassospira xiamenensis]|uniref:Uncharacterized protein n=1 Tax=Thalassospira xiamenensis TaxID=220697 RepID=A0ABR5XWR3_9PROT|nr:hypothetical protein [Thalassospira xiamenensis]KZC97193.1 hypothetical protein AUP40_04450 [Thalassospira xiamenensis]KZD10214.1 hypothetical protein AUP45_02760 [Thalassospira xiamenensis]MCD1593138.1 hypothetical protein [Thalassospira xiamenensis]